MKFPRGSSLLLIFCLLLESKLWAQLGGFATSDVIGSHDNPEPFQYRLPVNKTSHIKGPVPSNRWWSNLLVRDEVKLISPFPLFYSAVQKEYPAEGKAFGIAVDYRGEGAPFPRAFADSEIPKNSVRQISTDIQPQYLIRSSSLERSSTKTRLHEFGDWHIVTETADQHGHRFYTTMTAGSPYSYYQFEEGQPKIHLNSFAGRLEIWDAAGHSILPDQGDYLGDSILVRVLHPLTKKPSFWAFFAPPDTSWQRRGEDLTITLGQGASYLSSALIPSPQDFSLYYQHAYAKIIGTQATPHYDEARAEVVTTFQFQTELLRQDFSNEVLTTVFPHQYKHMQQNQLNSNLSYKSQRGALKVWSGTEFTTKLRNQGILLNFNQPSQSPSYDAASHQQWMQWESYVKNAFGVDTYGTGKSLLRAAQSLATADAIELPQLKQEIAEGLSREFADWFTYSPGAEGTFWSDNLPIKFFSLYSPQEGHWGHLVGWRASFGAQALNDVHLHYGYWVHAAAILAKYQPKFVEDYGWAVDMLIRNMASPDRADSQFPYLRTFDPYTGRSYASGYYWFGYHDGNDLESTSEALNAWQAIYQWGQITGQKHYRDLGLYLYWTERSAVEQYWLDVDEEVHHPDYAYPLVGILREGSYEFNTHWGSQEIEELYGIQLLPLTPATLHLGLKRDYMRKIWQAMSQVNQQKHGADFNTWHGTMLNFLALVNPAAAAARFRFGEMAGPPGQQYSPLQDHETWSTIYHFIHALQQLGRPISGYWADAPGYGVFEKDGQHTFVAFNPSRSQDLTVRFYNEEGLVHTIFNIPPGKTIYSAFSPN